MVIGVDLEPSACCIVKGNSFSLSYWWNALRFKVGKFTIVHKRPGIPWVDRAYTLFMPSMLHGRKAYSGSWATTEPCTRVRWVCVVGICWLNGKPFVMHRYPDSKVPGANMGPIWGRQDPGGPHVGPMNFAIAVVPYILPLNHSFLAVSNIKQNSLFCFCYIFRGQFYQFASTDPVASIQPIS